jgi:hypothetical protein
MCGADTLVRVKASICKLVAEIVIVRSFPKERVILSAADVSEASSRKSKDPYPLPPTPYPLVRILA